MKGTKRFFNVLHKDCNLQSPELQKTVNQLRTVMAKAEKKGGFIITQTLYQDIASKCDTLQEQTQKSESIKALRKIQSNFDRLYMHDYHDLEDEECMDSIIPDIWDPISDD